MAVKPPEEPVFTEAMKRTTVSDLEIPALAGGVGNFAASAA
jgi:hypothetical protein